MGAKVSVGKSFTFASTPEGRADLENTRWDIQGGKIRVVKAFKYLGAQVSAANKLVTTVVSERFRRATIMTRKLARLCISKKAKEKVTHSAIYATSPSTKTIWEDDISAAYLQSPSAACCASLSLPSLSVSAQREPSSTSPLLYIILFLIKRNLYAFSFPEKCSVFGG